MTKRKKDNAMAKRKTDNTMAKRKMNNTITNKGNNKITELRTILQRESQNS